MKKGLFQNKFTKAINNFISNAKESYHNLTFISLFKAKKENYLPNQIIYEQFAKLLQKEESRVIKDTIDSFIKFINKKEEKRRNCLHLSKNSLDKLKK